MCTVRIGDGMWKLFLSSLVVFFLNRGPPNKGTTMTMPRTAPPPPPPGGNKPPQQPRLQAPPPPNTPGHRTAPPPPPSRNVSSPDGESWWKGGKGEGVRGTRQGGKDRMKEKRGGKEG